ncbi:hypothetical protein J3E72DRAFT_370926 [Bipolaris maydis]|nr:hypothetical protein J3E72DRAFT_370926 [Bipolaris maydis]
MDSIVSKVRIELGNLAATYAANKHENVTLSLTSDFQRALFFILDERIRIKDLEQSKELREKMVQLFEDEYSTEPAWLYLNQFKKQDRCFAKLDCLSKDEAARYKHSSCQEHFMCKNHKSSPCIAKHDNIVGQRYQAKNDTKNAGKIAVDVENANMERLIGEEIGKNMAGNEELGKNDVERSFLATGDLNKEKQLEPVARETIGMAKSSKDVQCPWVDYYNYDIGSLSSEESELDDDVVNEEEKNWQNIDIGG